MFVVDQIGLIKVITADGKLQDEPFLDISDRMIRLSSGYNSSAAYGIPADNPFVNDTGFLPEIWAYGLRNPYRITFDSAGRLFAADAGQNLWEEVDLIIKGGNYGWNIREDTGKIYKMVPSAK